MENSIETIWTQGFLMEETLAAPRVNKLYQKKSKLLIDKLKRTYRTDNKCIIPLAVLAVIGFSVVGHIAVGFYIMALMIGMFFLNRKNIASLEKISINSTSYEYLVNYQKMFSQLKKFYTRLLGFGLPPAGIFGYYLFFRNTEILLKILQLKPIYIVAVVLALSIILAAVGILSYLLSIKLIYGNFIRRLDEIIADMEELRR